MPFAAATQTMDDKLGMIMKIDNYEDLEVYKLALKLQQEIFVLTFSFPKEEQFALTDQVRRSSRSIGANISEAWRKRCYVAHFRSKLTDSDTEQAETQHWLRTASLCKYISGMEFNKKLNECRHIGSMLGKMIIDVERWCYKL
jgi:four helix bundle protein